MLAIATTIVVVVCLSMYYGHTVLWLLLAVEYSWPNDTESTTPTILLRLPGEGSFQQHSMMCCIPTNHKDPRNHPKSRECKLFVSQSQSPNNNNNKNKERIAIMAPPGTLLDAFYDWIRANIPNDNNNKYELISTSHVPPYGYGKTHGWTRIIRLVTDPILIQVLDSGGSNNNDAQDRATTLRQVVRWHCRLSHVSAHTSLLSVSLTELLLQPKRVLQDIFDFLEYAAKAPSSLVSVVELQHRHDAILAGYYNTRRDNAEEESVLLSSVLEEEMRVTHQLSDWPCLSFWIKGASSASSDALAKELVPECNSPFSKCVVARDVCEAKGDVECKG